MLHHYGNNNSNHGSSSSFFSLLFPFSGSKQQHSPTSNTSSYYDSFASSPAAVDCTLSLATPSTRHAETTRSAKPHYASRQSSTTGSWDVAAVSTESNHNGYTKQLNTNTKEADANSARLTRRRCANCDTTSTPLWRNGPRGPKSLCNACGIRYKKEERRAAAAAAVSPILDCTSGHVSGYSYQSSHQQQNWGCYASTVGKSTGFTSYGDDTLETRDLSYMPWRLNIVPPQPFPVVDRTGLYQYN